MTTVTKSTTHVAPAFPEEPLLCTLRPSSPWMPHARLLSLSLGQGGKTEDLEKPLSEAAWGLKAEGLQHSGTGIGQDTVNASFLVKDQEELGFIFHVWDVARGQGALNPSGMRSFPGRNPRRAPLRGRSTESRTLPPGEGRCHHAKRQRRNTEAAPTPRRHRDAGNGKRRSRGSARGWRWKGPTRGVELGAPRRPAPGSWAHIQRLGSPSPADARPLRCPRCTPVPVPAAGCYSN